MIKVKRIDHVAIATGAVATLEPKLATLFGLAPSTREHVADQGTDVVFLAPPDGDACIELIAPAGNESLKRFVDKRGTALHHICFEVDDLATTLRTLADAGVPLVDQVPRRGARGHWVGFIHPQATGGVLFELCQPTQGDHA